MMMRLTHSSFALHLAFFVLRRGIVECTPRIVLVPTRDNFPSPSSNWLTVRGGANDDDEGISSVVMDMAATSQLLDDEIVTEGVNSTHTSSTNTVTSHKTSSSDIDGPPPPGGIEYDEDFIASLVFAASKPGDGSESDPDGIPTRFLNMQKGNRQKARAAFEHTVQWRKENNVDSILKRPQPKFDLCKRVFPVYVPGRDRQNNIVVVQRIGLIDIELAEKNDINGDDLLWYYIYIVEFCWNIVEPEPSAVMTTILDLKGVRLKTFRDGKIRDFIRNFVGAMSENYPNRSHRTLVINAPNWINSAYNLVKKLLRKSTREKISILNGGGKQDSVLIEVLGADHVPRELLTEQKHDGEDDGETKTTGHVESDIEENLRLLVSVLKPFSSIEAISLTKLFWRSFNQKHSAWPHSRRMT